MAHEDVVDVGSILTELAPGPELSTALSELDHESLDDYALVEVAAAYKRLEAWAAAQAARAAGALSHRPELNQLVGVDADGGHVATKRAAVCLAPRLGITRHAATQLVANGRAFDGGLQLTGDALRAGLLDYAKADLIRRSLEHQPTEVSLAVELRVLDRATLRTRPQVANDVERALIAVDPHEADTRARKARKSRRVGRVRALPDGMASLHVVLSAVDAVALDIVLDAAARAAKNTGDRRTFDQLRADCLALMAHTALARGEVGALLPRGDEHSWRCAHHAHPPPSRVFPRHLPATALARGAPRDTSGPPPPPCCSPPPPLPPHGLATSSSLDGPHTTGPPAPGEVLPAGGQQPIRLGMLAGGRTKVNVTVPLSVLLPDEAGAANTGAAERDPLSDEPAEVAELEGYGPLAPEAARALALGGAWQRLVTDPRTGAVLDVGRTRYQPPAELAELVRQRDRTCVVPGCNVPARSCDLDHATEWQDGGATSPANLQALCQHDHGLKTVGDYQVRRQPDGSYEVITPTGHVFRRHADGAVTQHERLAGEPPPEDPALAELDALLLKNNT